MLRLRIYPAEFVTLLAFIGSISRTYGHLLVLQQSVPVVVLLEYGRSLTLKRIFTWQRRPRDKQFLLELPLPVACSLYQLLRFLPLTTSQQALLAHLEGAIQTYTGQVSTEQLI